MAETTSIKSTLVITFLKGNVIVKDENGNEHVAKLGEVLTVGEMLVTGSDGQVELKSPDGGEPVVLAENKELLIEANIFGVNVDPTENAIAQLNQESQSIIDALNKGVDLTADLDPTAAGLNAGDSAEDGHGFVRLLRIVEELGKQSFQYNITTSQPTDDIPPGSGVNQTSDSILVPAANTDVNSIQEDGSNPIKGNVLSNDYLGSNPSTQPVSSAGTFTGAYGSLLLNADGSYTYTLDNQNATVNALNDGQSIHDVFSYTLTDSQGNTSTANLDITING
ncbi:retention module-containing protein, partial [Leeia sp. TBRC 13508]